MAKITKETVEHTARLACLKFDDKELELYTQKFSRVLEYVEKLGKIDTKKIEPTSHAVLGEISAMREDKVEAFPAAEDILKNFPERDENFVRVPKTVDVE